MPTPFVVNASNECTFLCFSIACTKNTHEKLCASNYRRTCECVLLVTKIEGDDNFYYAEISNNWLTLNKSCDLAIMNDLDCKN